MILRRVSARRSVVRPPYRTNKREKPQSLSKFDFNTTIPKCVIDYDVFTAAARGGYFRGDTSRLAIRKVGCSTEDFLATKAYDSGGDKFTGDGSFDVGLGPAQSCDWRAVGF